MISSDQTQVEHYHRLANGDWLLHSAKSLEDVINLEFIDAALPLNQLYEAVDLPDEPRPLR